MNKDKFGFCRLSPVSTIPTQSPSRIEYIDALRGFTMILVVLCHVSGHCLGIDNSIPSANIYLRQFRMPMFFFISGFVLYKNSVVWTLSTSFRFLCKKFPVQIIGPTLFFLSFLTISDIPYIEGFFNKYKEGYWFTYILYLFYIFYVLLSWITHRSNISWISDVFLVTCGMGFYILSLPSVLDRLPIDEQWKNFLSMMHWGYFFFFVLGSLAKKYFIQIQYWLDFSPLLLISIVTYFGMNIFRGALESHFFGLFSLVVSLTGVVILFGFFRHYQISVSQQTKLGKMLQYIGRHTLEIYLIHYFVLPTRLFEVFSLFHDTPMPLLELAISSAISILVITACLFIGNVLRMSSFIAKWFFGVRHERRNYSGQYSATTG